MKTSTLRRLPIPFVVACFLGIGVIGFLLLSSGGGDQQTAKNGASSAQPATPQPTDSSRYRVKRSNVASRSGVAKLNRSATGTARPAQQSRATAQTKAKARNQQAKPANAVARNTNKTSERTRPETSPAPRQTVATSPKSESAVQGNSRAESKVASTTAPRRDLDRVKSAKVAATTKPTPTDAYSPENPDPSELLSQALSSDLTADVQPEIEAPSIVMPPSADLDESALVAPKVNSAEMTKNVETPDQGSATKAVAPEADTDPASVVNGELMADATKPAPKKTVRIINPTSNPLPVWFVTHKRKVQLQPGQRYETSADQDLLVRFARGGDLGVDRVTTSEGDWVFSVTRKEGWKLTQN